MVTEKEKFEEINKTLVDKIKKIEKYVDKDMPDCIKLETKSILKYLKYQSKRINIELSKVK